MRLPYLPAAPVADALRCVICKSGLEGSPDAVTPEIDPEYIFLFGDGIRVLQR